MAKARSPKGSGSYDKCDGLFRWRIGVYDPTTGKTRYKSLKAKTQSALEAKVQAWKEANGGELPPAAQRRVRVNDFAEVWLADVASRREARTVANYGATAKRYIVPRFGSMYLQKVSVLSLQTFFNELSCKLSAATVLTIRAHFRAFFALAVKFELIPRNPVQATSPPRYQKPELKILEEADVARSGAYRRTPQNDEERFFLLRDYLIVLLAASSGMRQGEILGLTWDCVNGTQVKVMHSLQDLPGARVLKSPKNHKPRNVIIPAAVARELEAWREFMGQYAAKYKGFFVNEQGFVFPSSRGGCMDAGSFVSRTYHAMLAAAGLSGVRFHDLRHFFASSALSRGVPVAAVSEQLGHSSIAITFDRYTHILKRSRDELREALESNTLFSSL